MSTDSQNKLDQELRLVYISTLSIESSEFWDSWNRFAMGVIPSGYEFAEAFEGFPMPEDECINADEIWAQIENLEYYFPRFNLYERCIAQIYWLDYLIRRLLNKELRP